MRPALPRGPRHALFTRYRTDPLVDELLQALALVRFGRVDVALRVHRNTVDAEELAGLPAAVAEARENLHRVALDDVDLLVLAIRQIDVPLLRILRERDVPHRTVAKRSLGHEQ